MPGPDSLLCEKDIDRKSLATAVGTWDNKIRRKKKEARA